MLNKFSNLSLYNNFFKKIYFSENIKINFFFFKNQKFLILQNFLIKSSYYLLIPQFLNCIYKNNFLYLILNSKTQIKYKTLYFFLINLNFGMKQLNKINTLTLLIRGVGLKITSVEKLSSVLSLKLGFSHLILLPIPKDISKISFFKKKIILCSFNQILLGNFASIIYKYKPINIFTGKGLLKKQKKKFKLKEYIKKL
jgi:hypothetical protein